MTDDERAARIWVEHASISLDPKIKKLGHTLQRLLDRPVMPRPEDLPDSVVVKIADAHRIPYADFRGTYRALYDHYTAPPASAKVERWCIVSSAGEIVSGYATEAEARGRERGPNTRVVKLVEADDADE